MTCLSCSQSELCINLALKDKEDKLLKQAIPESGRENFLMLIREILLSFKPHQTPLTAAPVSRTILSLLFHSLTPLQTLLTAAVHMQKLFLPPHTPPPLSSPPAAWEIQTFFLIGRKKGVLPSWKGKQRNGLKRFKLEFYGYFSLSFVSPLNFSFVKTKRTGMGKERKEGKKKGGRKKSPQIFMCDTAQGGETYGWFA